MGAANVAAALVVGKALPPSTKLILVRMALVSLDADKPPRYFAGWELLAETLGRDVPPADLADKAVTTRRRNQQTDVARHVKALRKAGLIEQVGIARTGRNAEYWLRLDHVIATSPTAGLVTAGLVPERDQPDHHKPFAGVIHSMGVTPIQSMGKSPTLSMGESPSTAWVNHPSLGVGGGLQELDQEEVVAFVTNGSVPRASRADADSPISTLRCPHGRPLPSSDGTTCVCGMCRIDAALGDVPA